MKELPVILGVILVCGYCVLLLIRPGRLERDRQAVAEIRAQAEKDIRSAIGVGEAALQPFIDDLSP